MKDAVLFVVAPADVTVITPVVAPVGTVTVSVVAVAAVTVAGVVLNNTVLFAGVVSNFVPVIITEVPTVPDVGANEATLRAGVGVTTGSSSFLQEDTAVKRPSRTSKKYILFFKILIGIVVGFKTIIVWLFDW
ncbi:hypothetical protein Dfri01_34660 [Dyadobacter frigoris]|nr:hypothetical protein Dfri01_34660 [Dyadobacter frigoris]